ncbi:hypothetical protein GC176_10105 [bacterium]|nr:hypothetical protein [bacterium]
MSGRTTLFHRAAVAIHEQLTLNQSEMPEGLPAVSWTECCRLSRLIEKAERKGWHAAVRRQQGLLAQAIRRLTVALNEMQESLALPKPGSIPTVRDVLADLQALSTEFGEIKVSTTNHTIGVLTDCVILDGVGLGRFEIVLDWEHLHETGAYDVIAQDGCAAETDSDTTHPHV